MPHPFTPRGRLSHGRLKHLVVACIFTIITYYYVSRGPPTQFALLSPKDAAGNSTLGFQKILVLSEGPSWRTRGLKAAAEHTGLDVEIPKQPPLTVEMIEAFQKLGPENVPHPVDTGEVRNWLSSLDLVKYMVMADLESALFLEDDVDWDVSVKDQMRLVSDAVREFTLTDSQDRSPYGHAWDILWIGHSGEPTVNKTRRLEYDDPSAPLPANYIGWSKRYMDGITPGKRAVQRSSLTVASFAIGFSRRGAMKVLKWAGKGEDKAFDIRLQQGCKFKDLSCLVINPELMHHYVPPTDFGHISTVADANLKGSKAEEEEFEHVMGDTPNILHSARCRALFDSTCPRN
ncbi:uncharacterized protein PAC_02432 [Phialocephala subalpina]|uniref:Glycosyltransferase family 25 protein n=1 Tax=Phialocephala subalpina TaxID=576137 RepID=A0A1L7WIH0_9HELO|nr:uncharacterized protein PAC_02432 [Phialocephala subalpina]